MSKSDNLRYSIIPARAITDASVTAQALRVLALLGRHTDDNGWCRRSQVKMAEELGCSRGTVQNALDLLISPENGKGYVERREETRTGVAPKEGRHPHCSYSYRVRLDLDDLKDARASGLARRVPVNSQHPVPIHDQHPVPASLAPLTEPSPCERPLVNADARACGDDEGTKKPKAKKQSPYTSGFERVWSQFLKWPDNNGSKWDAWQAYQSVADVRPADGDLVVAVRAESRWLAEQNRHRKPNDPHPPPHPSTWLRRRGWERHLDAVAAADSDPDWKPRRITLAPEHIEALRNTGLSEQIVAAWFADGRFAQPSGAAPSFIAATRLKRDYIRDHYIREVLKAFGVKQIALVYDDEESKAA